MLIGLCISLNFLWASVSLDISSFPHAADYLRRASIGGFGEQSSLIFENPAALAFQDYPLVMSVFNAKLLDNRSQLKSLSFSHRSSKLVWGIAWMQYETPNIPKTRTLLRVDGMNDYFPKVDYYFSYYDSLIKFAFARTLNDYISIGSNFNYFKYKMDVVEGKAYDLDLALFSKLNNKHSFSFMFKNILPNSRMAYKNTRSLPLPKQLKVGHQYNFSKFRLYSQISLDYKPYEDIASTLDITPAIAIELPLLANPNIVFSIGYSQQQQANKNRDQFSMGVGAKFKQLNVDFAFENSDYHANDKHYFLSLSYQFGQKKNSNKPALPMVQKQEKPAMIKLDYNSNPRNRIIQKRVPLIAIASSQIKNEILMQPKKLVKNLAKPNKSTIKKTKEISVPKLLYEEALAFKPPIQLLQKQQRNNLLDQPLLPEITANISSTSDNNQSTMALFILLLMLGLGGSILLLIKIRS